MKRFNILQFFSKKGVLVIGLVAGMMLSLLCCNAVSAEELDTADDDYMLICDYTRPNVYHTKLYVRNDIYLSKQVAILKQGDSYLSRCSSLLSTLDSFRFNETKLGTGSNAGKQSEWCLSGNGSSFASATDVTAFFVPVFDSQEKIENYFSTGDYSGALNYDELLNMEQKGEQIAGIDDTLPCFDKSVMQLNQNNSVTYQSSMSPDMQTEFYEMCVKVADKDGSGNETEHYKAYVEMTATALYADRKALGLFNSNALELAGTVVNKDKLDEVIQFGSDGRIEVASFVGHSGGGGRRSLADSMFHEKSDAPLIAVEVDSIALSDKNSSFPGVVRNLSTERNLVDVSLEGYSPLFGTLVEYSAYTLVGYAADVRIIYYDVSTGTYTASRDTYTYTWVYTTLQDRYGSGTIGYDSEGNIVSKNEFDNLNSDVGGSWGTLPDYEESADGVLNNIRNGFGLLGNNGLLALCQHTFTAIPLWIWVLVGMLISVNIIVIGLKIARGM